MVADEKWEPRPNKCRCKQFVDYKIADEMVKTGEAKWVVVARERGVQEKPCKLCVGMDASPNCEICKGTGKMNVPVVWDTYNYDIVLVKHRTKSNKISTPRVPTIEEEHIERAYVEENKEAAERIEEYGMLILEARAFPGPARCCHAKDKECTRCALPAGIKEYAIGKEPKDDPSTGVGRTYDFGRAI